MSIDDKTLEARFANTKVLVIDDEHYMRKVVRTLPMSIGVRTVYEAPDGIAGLESIRSLSPDVVIVDWQMPSLDGPGFVRMVRSPDTFPFPNVPIIMLTGHGERARVVQALEVGVNEFLLKPVSSKALRDRLISVLFAPRPMVKTNGYYGPAPRKPSTVAAEIDRAAHTEVVLVN
jgi:two-component system, chemotaxis family, chemotaxis protein CheY